MIMNIKLKFRLLILFPILIFSPELKSQEHVKHPEWSYDKVIYEVNLRQYTEEGTFKAFEKHLPRLKELGVRILWFMPIHPIGEKNRKGTMGSYYAVKDYKAINPEHGTSDDFKSLIDRIHEMDMYIIIDWVANHTAWDNVWVSEHPEFYTKDASGNFVPPVDDWSDVIDLNFKNKKLWSYMADAMKFWVEEYNIDGYRCDVAGMVPLEFWLEVKKELDNIKPVFMLAEAWEPELHQAFDMTYSWDIHHLMNDIAKGKKNADDLKARIIQETEMYPESAFRMQFTSNHDENSWNGTVWERLGDAAETFAVLSFIIPGMPLIYSGQEAGLDKRLEFFEKDLIEWKEHSFRELYTNLCRLKKENEALHNGEKGGTSIFINASENNEGIFSFVREGNSKKVFAVFNLTNSSLNFNAESSLIEGNYTEFSSGDKIKFDSSASFELKPWEYKIFNN